jgi:hypothetical protein
MDCIEEFFEKQASFPELPHIFRVIESHNRYNLECACNREAYSLLEPTKNDPEKEEIDRFESSKSASVSWEKRKIPSNGGDLKWSITLQTQQPLRIPEDDLPQDSKEPFDLFSRASNRVRE